MCLTHFSIYLEIISSKVAERMNIMFAWLQNEKNPFFLILEVEHINCVW